MPLMRPGVALTAQYVFMGRGKAYGDTEGGYIFVPERS